MGSNNVAKTKGAPCGLQLFWPHSLIFFFKWGRDDYRK